LGVTLKRVKFALVGASLLIGAGAANAADVYQRGSIKDAPEAYYPPITWTGFYAGVHVGGAFGGEVDLVVDDENFSLFDLDNAFTGGVHVGYNWQASQHWVVGIEGSISALSLEAEDVFGDEELSDYVASIRGRAGVAFDQNLVYGTAGIAFLGYSDLSADILGEDTGVGFVIGAGWERKFSDNISFGIEGLYYNFEEDIADTPLEVEADFWTVTARLNYHFNRGYDDPLK
jgi:outer membrane immunogenic protein